MPPLLALACGFGGFHQRGIGLEELFGHLIHRYFFIITFFNRGVNTELCIQNVR